MNRKDLVDLLTWIFALIFSFAALIFLEFVMSGTFWREEILEEAEYTLAELESSEIKFHINKLVTGKHELRVYFVPAGNAELRQMRNPINFRLTVRIRRGDKLKEKEFVKTFDKINTIGRYHLFSVPNDFLWSRNASLEINVVNISYDNVFSYYFQKVNFEIRHLQIVGGH